MALINKKKIETFHIGAKHIYTGANPGLIHVQHRFLQSRTMSAMSKSI